MDDHVAAIKERVRIEALVGEEFEVVGRGRVLTTKQHDSLKLFTDTNTWYWFSQGRGGDVFDWWMASRRCDFRQALDDLERRAGVEPRPLTPERQAAIESERSRGRVLDMAARYYNQVLLSHPAARAGREYCHARGWTDETMRAARLGFVPELRDSVRDDIQPLSAQLYAAGLMERPAAQAVLSLPGGHLVYVHQRGGQVVYLSARSVAGKRHYNPPADLCGPRQMFELRPLVTAVTPGATVLVEGQADAISLAQLGFHAVALCGVEAGAPQGITHVALDNDEAGQAKALDLALRIGPLTHVVVWPPAKGKDANDLLRGGALPGEVAALLAEAPPAIVALAARARGERGDARQTDLTRLAAAFRNLDEMVQADLTPTLAEALGVKLSHFKRLMKAADDQAAAERAETADEPTRYENSAGGAVGGYVFEQCVAWDGDGTPLCRYAVRLPSGEIRLQNTVDAGGTTYVPFPATINLIRKQVVLFPSEPAEFGSQQALLAEIRAFIHRWLDVDPFYEQLASYYVMFTWLYDLFETLPYLRALGDYGTGKSRFLQTIGALCYRPMFVSGAATAAPIFRVIDMFRGTLIVDEADFARSDASVEIVKIINVGYARGGVVLRAEKDEGSDTYYPSAADVYGPKILATRRLFEDRATESRCLTKRMSTARPRPEISRVINRQFWADAEAIRNKLLMYRLRHHRPLEVDPALSDFSIEPRLDQVTLALKSLIADAEMREQINTFVRAYNATLITDRQMSLPAIVVQVLANIFYRPEQTLTGPRRDFSMKKIAEEVRLLLDTLDPDEKVSPRRISQILSEDLGLSRREQDAESRRHCLVVEEPALQALMARYGIDPILNETTR